MGRNSRFPPLPLVAALGLALGFYPLVLPLAFLLGLAFVAVALGATLLRFQGSELRYPGLVIIVTGCFLFAGAVLSREARKETGQLSGARLGIVELSGSLPKDSSPTRKGSTLYRLEVETLRVKAPGLVGELHSLRAGRPLMRIDLLVQGGPLLDAGTRVVLRGRPRGGTAGTLLFAQARDLGIMDRGAPLARFRSSIRSAARAALLRVGDRSAGLLLALILGAQDALEREDADAFRAAGCSHILALSGEHLSVLALVALLLLKPLLGPLKARFGAALLSSLFVWIAGPAPSLLRAVLMVWLGALVLALDRPQSWLMILALSFTLSLPLDLEAARSLSFVLSYLAVWGLAVLMPRLTFLLGRWLPPFLASALGASLAAQTATAPVVIGCFGSLSLVGAFASLVAAPLVTALMWWGMAAALVCSALPSLAVWLVPVSDLLYLLLSWTMRGAAALPLLQLGSAAATALATAVVVAAALFVYARPDVDYLHWLRARVPAGASRLRLPRRSQAPPRGGGARHVQALRAELSRE